MFRFIRRISALLTALALAVTTIAVTAEPAHAEQVWAVGGGTIIIADTGAKNTGNHTQWVNSIYVETGTSESNSYGCGKFESWTQGFYAATERCGNAYWTINRWVADGNNVCGAFDDFGGWPRRIACIAIRV